MPSPPRHAIRSRAEPVPSSGSPCENSKSSDATTECDAREQVNLEQIVDDCLRLSREALLRKLGTTSCGLADSGRDMEAGSTQRRPVRGEWSLAPSVESTYVPKRRVSLSVCTGTDSAQSAFFSNAASAKKQQFLLTHQESDPGSLSNETRSPLSQMNKNTQLMQVLGTHDTRSAPIRITSRSNSDDSLCQQVTEADKNLGDIMAHAVRLELNAMSTLTRGDLRHMEPAIDVVVAVIIVANVIQMGISTDLEADWFGWVIIDIVFTVAFILEFFLKVAIHGLRGHVCGDQRAWTLFDILIIVLAIGELVLRFASTTDKNDGFGFSLFRIIRLFRLTRILKVLRLPIFADLVSMIDGLMYGSRTLCWALALLLVPIWAAAIIFREVVGNSSPKDVHYVKPFTTFPDALFTIFRCIMGDCSSETGQPIPIFVTQEFGPLFGIGLSLLFAATSFGLFNVIIAIYVANIEMAQKRTEATMLQTRLTDPDLYNHSMAELVRIFTEEHENEQQASDFQAAGRLSPNSSGSMEGQPEGSVKFSKAKTFAEVDVDDATRMELTKDFFEKVIQKDEVRAIFDRLDLERESWPGIFEVLDADGGGSLSLSEILQGLTMLRGHPRRSDTIANTLILRTIQRDQGNQMSRIVRKMTDVSRKMTLLAEVFLQVDEPVNEASQQIRTSQALDACTVR